MNTTEVVAALIWDDDKFMIFQRPVHKARGLLWEFAACKQSGASTDSAEAQALVTKLHVNITANYYTCADKILSGLGKMYVADERFKKNIDKYGEGTAEYVGMAISHYKAEDL